MSSILRLEDLLDMAGKRVITEKQYQLGLAKGMDVTRLTLQSDFTAMMSEHKRTTLNPQESYTLLEKLDYTTICQILRRKVNYISEITHQEYQTLMKVCDSPKRLWISSQNYPVKNTSDWEYGWQKSNLCRDGKLWYLKSHLYFMADIDTQESTEDIRTKLKAIAYEHQLTFRLYKTYAGYHVHLTSGFLDCASEQSTELMRLLGGDIWYSVYSERMGYKIRVSPKLRLEGKKDIVGKYLGVIGKYSEKVEILDYLERMQDLIIWHTDSNESYFDSSF